ncbi:MAG: nicotinate (nicotinamide) nucleotide adenylyltransferase [Bacteroidales bacterium]|jgi:nicotinate-nucleotide adenylyltransferase|nr:nicotinate (nicotinamide) nucleotide adenylyltransferase [Bacteroidales bacterium]
MKYGLYFGSFNPLHRGHIKIALYAVKYCGLDRVLFVVSPHSPFKDKKDLSDAGDRLSAVREAVGKTGEEHLGVSDIEFHLDEPLYTYNTLLKFKELYPDGDFSILMGADNLAILEKWHKGKEIIKEYRIIVYPRKGYDAEALCRKYGATYLPAPLLNISSTMIREGISEGRDMDEYLP